MKILYLELDGKKIFDREDLHDVLEKDLQLPDYYGRNLDALEDLLTSYQETLLLNIQNEKELFDHLGSYYEDLMTLFYEGDFPVYKRWNKN